MKRQDVLVEDYFKFLDEVEYSLIVKHNNIEIRKFLFNVHCSIFPCRSTLSGVMFWHYVYWIFFSL